MAVPTWKYRAGLALIGAVVIIWVASAEVTQIIFSTYPHPFILTWVGASMLAIYLPLAFIKDAFRPWILRKLQRNSIRETVLGMNLVDLPTPVEASSRIPLTVSPRSLSSKEIEMHSLQIPPISGKHDESERLLEKTPDAIVETSPPIKEIIKMAITLAPLWLLTEYLSNLSLSMTSVSSATLLSSTSSLFTLMFGALLGEDKIIPTKVIAVVASIVGVVMTELGKSTAVQQNDSSGKLLNLGLSGVAKSPEHSITGDLVSLASAASYGFYTSSQTYLLCSFIRPLIRLLFLFPWLVICSDSFAFALLVMLRKHSGEEGEAGGTDMQKLFGCIGLVTLVGLWWIGLPLMLFGLEPGLKLPRNYGLDEDIVGNALIGSVVSDYFWALSVVWTTPLVATLGLSLTIPLAMVADIVMHGRKYSAVYIIGAAQVFVGFLVANLADRFSQHRQ